MRTARDVEFNRKSRKWRYTEQLARLLWFMAYILFRLSPRNLFWGFRVWLLRRFGAKIGSGVRIASSCKITMPWNVCIGDYSAIGDGVILYALGKIHIKKFATISQGAHLCAGTHDWRDDTMPLLKLPITIGRDAWICADAFIGPNVEIGDRAIVGARAVAMRSVGNDEIVIGNPAQIVSRRNQARKRE